MVSDFRRKKFTHVFTVLFDTDKNGSVDKNDFDLIAQKVATLRGWKTGEPAYKVAIDALQEVWSGLQGADANSDGQVSLDEWISAWENYPAKTADWQTIFARLVFQVEDGSLDGSIDSEEFSNLFVSFGLDKAQAVAAFQKLSGGGSVSWDKFEGLFKDYFSSEDVNAPGNFIFGKTSF